LRVEGSEFRVYVLESRFKSLELRVKSFEFGMDLSSGVDFRVQGSGLLV
jgi:hypothetical protein